MGILNYIREQKQKFEEKKALSAQVAEIKAQERLEAQKVELKEVKEKRIKLQERHDVEAELIREKALIKSMQPPTAAEKIGMAIGKIANAGREAQGKKRRMLPLGRYQAREKDNRPRNSLGGVEPFK